MEGGRNFVIPRVRPHGKSKLQELLITGGLKQRMGDDLCGPLFLGKLGRVTSEVPVHLLTS